MKRNLLLVFLLTLSISIELSGITFKEAKEIALRNNRNLDISRMEVKKVELQMKKAWASFYPTVELQSSYTRMLAVPQFEVETPQGTQSIPMGYADNYQNSLQVTFPLFTFGKRTAYKEVAERGVKIQEYQNETDKIDLIKDLTSVFYGVISGKEGVKIAEKALERSKDHLQTARIQYREGRITKLELLSAETEVNERKTNFLTATNGLENARSALNILLGYPVDTTIQVEGDVEIKMDSLDIDTLWSHAIRKRPEIRSIEEINRVAEVNETIQYLSLLPDIVFSGAFTYNKPAQMTDEWDNNLTATVALSLPIFQGFSRMNRINEYQVSAEQSKIREKIIKEGIKTEVKNLLLNYRLNKQKVKLAEEQLKRARESYEMAKVQYENGYISNLEYKDIELGFMNAEYSFLNARYNLKISRKKLDLTSMLDEEDK